MKCPCHHIGHCKNIFGAEHKPKGSALSSLPRKYPTNGTGCSSPWRNLRNSGTSWTVEWEAVLKKRTKRITGARNLTSDEYAEKLRKEDRKKKEAEELQQKRKGQGRKHTKNSRPKTRRRLHWRVRRVMMKLHKKILLW